MKKSILHSSDIRALVEISPETTPKPVCAYKTLTSHLERVPGCLSHCAFDPTEPTDQWSTASLLYYAVFLNDSILECYLNRSTSRLFMRKVPDREWVAQVEGDWQQVEVRRDVYSTRTDLMIGA